MNKGSGTIITFIFLVSLIIFFSFSIDYLNMTQKYNNDVSQYDNSHSTLLTSSVPYFNSIKKQGTPEIKIVNNEIKNLLILDHKFNEISLGLFKSYFTYMLSKQIKFDLNLQEIPSKVFIQNNNLYSNYELDVNLLGDSQNLNCLQFFSQYLEPSKICWFFNNYSDTTDYNVEIPIENNNSLNKIFLVTTRNLQILNKELLPKNYFLYLIRIKEKCFSGFQKKDQTKEFCIDFDSLFDETLYRVLSDDLQKTIISK